MVAIKSAISRSAQRTEDALLVSCSGAPQLAEAMSSGCVRIQREQGKREGLLVLRELSELVERQRQQRIVVKAPA